MTRDEKISEARRLSAAGLSYGEIGRRLDQSRSCIAKWLNPERTREWNRRGNSGRARQDRKNQWTRGARKDPSYLKPCPECGKPTSAFVWAVNEPAKCWGCIQGEKETRWVRIEEMWAEGRTMRQIAEQLGVSMDWIKADFGKMRKAGRNLPHRRTPEQCARIRNGRWAA